MKTLASLVAVLVLLAPSAGGAQEPEAPEGATIKSAEVAGSALNLLSEGLKADINALVGASLSRDRVDALAGRIETENPDVVAAVRTLLQSDGQVRVVFFIARISDDANLVSNINARYVVDSVEVEGVPDSEIRASLWDELQSLVGTPLDQDEADRLTDRLRDEFPRYDVSRHIERGGRSGRIRVVYEVYPPEPRPWIPFKPSRSRFVFHEDHEWGALFDIPIGGRYHRVTPGFAFKHDDDLIEEYRGARLRVESRKLVTERLGASFEVSSFRQDWRPQTVAALALDPAIPELYRSRTTVEPTITFAFTPRVRVTGGVSFVELESLARPSESQQANTAIFGIAYDHTLDRFWRGEQSLGASYEVRIGASELGSDLSYKRHLANVRYRFDEGHSTVLASFMAGGFTGTAPLFERFTLGDTATLRGWSKFDLAPAGGDRMFHQSVEYRFWGLGVFLDGGSVWSSGSDMRIRFSTGFGVQTDHFFMTWGFPLDTDEVRSTFMIGVRF
jgi:hypothetical protein